MFLGRGCLKVVGVGGAVEDDGGEGGTGVGREEELGGSGATAWSSALEGAASEFTGPGGPDTSSAGPDDPAFSVSTSPDGRIPSSDFLGPDGPKLLAGGAGEGVGGAGEDCALNRSERVAIESFMLLSSLLTHLTTFLTMPISLAAVLWLMNMDAISDCTEQRILPCSSSLSMMGFILTFNFIFLGLRCCFLVTRGISGATYFQFTLALEMGPTLSTLISSSSESEGLLELKTNYFQSLILNVNSVYPTGTGGRHSKKRLQQRIGPLVSTLVELVSTHCPKTAQKVFWEAI
ncbi:hypothetical protein Taro_007666 [Colocasia esculenta]|uniref:Uncharacterized protein n=1 Tax=Colocasia esculenta TaxID=4460 RepID=A0A843TZM7_COLES|nr:hypothetical protein [Colocasia esculenta]